MCVYMSVYVDLSAFSIFVHLCDFILFFFLKVHLGNLALHVIPVSPKETQDHLASLAYQVVKDLRASRDSLVLRPTLVLEDLKVHCKATISIALNIHTCKGKPGRVHSAFVVPNQRMLQ